MSDMRLFEKLKAGMTTFGLCNMYPASGIIEGMCKDWDFVWIDGQHGQFSYESIFQAVQAAHVAGTESLIRVPYRTAEAMDPYVDLAPSALMIPMVDDAAQAREIVKQLRFPPVGRRSYGGRREIDLQGRNYHLQNELLVIAQVETLESLENVHEIIQVDGIDMLFFGADDMKLCLDIPIDTPVHESKELMQAMERTAQAAAKAGKFSGCVATNKQAVDLVAGMGYQLLIAGSDSGFIRSGSLSKLEEMRSHIHKPDMNSIRAEGFYS